MKKSNRKPLFLYLVISFFLSWSLLSTLDAMRFTRPNRPGTSYYRSSDFVQALQGMVSELFYDVNAKEARRLYEELPEDALLSPDPLFQPWGVIQAYLNELNEVPGKMASDEGSDQTLASELNTASRIAQKYARTTDLSVYQNGVYQNEPPLGEGQQNLLPVFRKRDLEAWLAAPMHFQTLETQRRWVEERQTYQYRLAEARGETDDEESGWEFYPLQILDALPQPVGYDSYLDFARKNAVDLEWLYRSMREFKQESNFVNTRPTEPLQDSNLAYRITFLHANRTYSNEDRASFEGAEWSAPLRARLSGYRMNYGSEWPYEVGSGKWAAEIRAGLQQFWPTQGEYVDDLSVELRVDTRMQAADALRESHENYERYQPVFWRWVVISGLLLLAWTVSLGVFLVRTPAREGRVVRWEDRIPVEGYLVLSFLFLLECLHLWYLFWPQVLSWTFPMQLPERPLGAVRIFLGALIGTVAAAAGLYLLSALVRKAKRHRFYAGSVLQWVVGKVYAGFQFLAEQRRRAGIPMVVLLLFGLFLFALLQTVPELLFLLVLFMGLLSLYLVLRMANEQHQILGYVQRLSLGDYSQALDASRFLPTNRKVAETLSDMEAGIQHAVEESVKNERMRTELITNVTHDIRTPLTSIINYTNLLQRQPLEDAVAREYVDVLERKAQRLKHLMNDLIDAARASSGALPMTFRAINLVELVGQVLGEYEDRWAERSLELVVEFDEPSLPVYADGNHLYRVMDNIIGNARKYAMPGTRVYVRVQESSGRAVVTVRNISEMPLNMEPEQFLERFQRGDAARTTGGSGLGLSIAESLTQRMHGDLELYIDGDLFKVTVSFARLEEGASAPDLETEEPMKKDKGKTNAMRRLEQQGLAYEVLHYVADAETPLDGVEVANRLGIPPEQVFKTLVAQGKTGRYYVFDLPVAATLDLKKAAKACGEKNVHLIPQQDLFEVTGYVRGGCSPIGMKKAYPTFMDCRAEQWEWVVVSAGRIGTQLRLSPASLQQATELVFADLVEE